MPEWLDWALHSGFAGLAILAIVVCFRAMKLLSRYETLMADYPPHRHVGFNGKSTIIYPKEYEPAPVERLSGGD